MMNAPFRILQSRFFPVIPPSRLVIRWFLLLLICLVFGTWRLADPIGQLMIRNAALVRLVSDISSLPPPSAMELVGLQQRPVHGLPARQMSLLHSLDNRSPTGGAILALLGQPSAAQAWLSSSVSAGKMRRFWLALVLAQQHQSEAAVHALTGLDGIDQYFALAGFAAQKAGEFENASQLLTAAAALDNGQIEDRSLVYEYLAKNAYNHRHDWDQSFYWAERWIQAVPDNTYAYTWLAGLYLWRNLPEQAYAVLQRGHSYRVEQNPYYPGQIGQIYQARGQWDLAIENYRKSWELHKDVTWMRSYAAWSLGFALYHESQREEARPYLEIAAQGGIQSAADILAQMKSGDSQ
jgi:tetratricopeptide (TPR) repeat protein